MSYAAEILMFPKLLSGPLMDPADLKEQMYRRTCTLRKLDAGLRDFIIGLSMKVLLANQIGGLWRQVKTIGFESVSTPMAWLGLVAYSLQLYLDFCGYSWMAIGVGEMLGFRLPRNFEHPYAARSMRDFWRRWHISLSSWFRDYVYIPLGGSKKGEGRTYLNLLVVWLFTGLWHGSTLNFLLWGLFLFVLISLERLGWGKVLRRSQVISRLYMLLVIPLSWMLFAIPSLKDIGSYLRRHGGPCTGLSGLRTAVRRGVGHRSAGVHALTGEALAPHPHLPAGNGAPAGAVLGMRLLYGGGHQRPLYVFQLLRTSSHEEIRTKKERTGRAGHPAGGHLPGSHRNGPCAEGPAAKVCRGLGGPSGHRRAIHAAA